MRMQEEELIHLLKEHGWYLIRRKRYHQTYLYAQKWKKGEFYITSVARLPHLSAERVLSKIQQYEEAG